LGRSIRVFPFKREDARKPWLPGIYYEKVYLLKQLWHPQVFAFHGFSISGNREKNMHVKKTIFKLIMNKL